MTTCPIKTLWRCMLAHCRHAGWACQLAYHRIFFKYWSDALLWCHSNAHLSVQYITRSSGYFTAISVWSINAFRLENIFTFYIIFRKTMNMNSFISSSSEKMKEFIFIVFQYRLFMYSSTSEYVGLRSRASRLRGRSQGLRHDGSLGPPQWLPDS